MIYCRKCGVRLYDDSKFCHQCGTPVREERENTCSSAFYETVPGDPSFQRVYPVRQAAPSGYSSEEQRMQAKSNMTFAIVAAALAGIGLPGLILAIISRKRVRDYQETYGIPAAGYDRAARIITRIALPVSIGFTVFWVVYILMIFSLISMALGRSRQFHV